MKKCSFAAVIPSFRLTAQNLLIVLYVLFRSANLMHVIVYLSSILWRQHIQFVYLLRSLNFAAFFWFCDIPDGSMEDLDGKWILAKDTACPEKDTSPATLGLTNMAGSYIMIRTDWKCKRIRDVKYDSAVTVLRASAVGRYWFDGSSVPRLAAEGVSYSTRWFCVRAQKSTGMSLPCI